MQRAGRILQPEEFVKEQDQIAELEGGGGENSSVNEKAADNLYEKSSSDHELDRDSRGASALGRLQEQSVTPNYLQVVESGKD